MKAQDDILDLGMRFEIESAHAGYVAKLALALFDGFQPLHGLGKSDRKLLYAASFLHDIGYASDPENHVIEGARILAENPIKAFASDDWGALIGTVLLHRRDWRSMLDHDVFPITGEKMLVRIKKLAAILRIADGLDHGHIQDARIFYCKHGKKSDKAGVEYTWYAGNIPWAEGKADLWETIYKRPFRFEGKLKHDTKLFQGVIHKKDSAASAARRLFYSQWCIMRDNVPGMREGLDPEHLHDYRVAMRRFRAALRMFQPVLGETHAGVLDDRLSELSDKLSPVRDAHVALQFMQSLESECGAPPNIMQSLESKVSDANRILRGIMESDFCYETAQLAGRFLRVELPALERDHEEPAFAHFAGQRLEKIVEKLLEQDISGLREGDPARLHEVRKQYRRGRYYAEFSAPVLGRDVRHAAKKLKVIAVALGDVRDARSLVDQLGECEVSAAIEKRENEAWVRFLHGWRKFAEK